MKPRLAALPLLAACGSAEEITRTVYVEVPVENAEDLGSLGSASESEDWNEDPGYPGDDDTGVTEIIPEGEEPEEVEITHVSDWACEHFFTTEIPARGLMHVGSNDPSLHRLEEGEGLVLSLHMEDRKDPDVDLFGCAAYGLMGSDWGPYYGSFLSYYEADPVTGEWLLDPYIELVLPHIDVWPERGQVVYLTFGYIERDTGESYWFMDNRPDYVSIAFDVFPEGHDPQVDLSWGFSSSP